MEKTAGTSTEHCSTIEQLAAYPLFFSMMMVVVMMFTLAVFMSIVVIIAIVTFTIAVTIAITHMTGYFDFIEDAAHYIGPC
jgi:hypothetical protein